MSLEVERGKGTGRAQLMTAPASRVLDVGVHPKSPGTPLRASLSGVHFHPHHHLHHHHHHHHHRRHHRDSSHMLTANSVPGPVPNTCMHEFYWWFFEADAIMTPILQM